jgi:hypothetical protein
VLLVRWDEPLGVALISHPWGLTLGSPEDVEAWRVEVFAKLESLEKTRAGRFPIVVCVDGLMIRPSAAKEYGKVARSYSERFASGLARFTLRPNGVGQIITVVAMTEGYRANLFTSRRAAVAEALSQHGRNGRSKG